jgi:conjugative transposon TraN protein
MKTLFLFFGLIITSHIFSQTAAKQLPPNTYIIPYHLEIGFNTTTVLVFPAIVKPGDKGKGDKEFIAQKQAGFENILKLKAARKNFISSNLHVFTSDGRIYAFDISYADRPDHTTYDLNKLFSLDQNDSLTTTESKAILSNGQINDAQLKSLVDKIKSAKPDFSRSTNKFLMKLQIRSIYACNGFTFFRLAIKNKSDLDYPIDFLRAYIKDTKRAKRTSFQQKEIALYYKDTTAIVPHNSNISYVFAVPSFTIPEQKRFIIELFEINGGRNISLSIKNKELFKAKAF